MLGITNLVFAILQTMIGSVGVFLVFIPLLISGLLYPFYVGYIRGAILFDETGRERVRGWLCFTIGIFFYMGLAPLILVRDFFPRLPVPTVFIALIFTAAGAFAGRRIVRWYLSLIEYQASESDLLLLGTSAACATALSLFTFILESYLYYAVVAPQNAIGPTPDLAGLVVLMWFLPGFILLERVIQKVTATNWVLKDRLAQESTTASQKPAPWFAASMTYLVSGAMECAILGAKSDKKGAAAYILAFVLTLPTLLPGLLGLIFGIVALFSAGIACWRFLRRPIKMP
jgi:hypothetical protein